MHTVFGPTILSRDMIKKIENPLLQQQENVVLANTLNSKHDSIMIPSALLAHVPHPV